MESTLEDLEKELSEAVGAPIDVSIPDSTEAAIRRDLRSQYVVEFRGLKEQMQVADAIGQEDAAKRAKEGAEIALKAIAEIDKRMKEAANGSAE